MNTFENLKSLAKTWVVALLFTANTTDALATTVKSDFEDLNKIETPVMNNFVEEHMEEIADTLKPKKELKQDLVLLGQEITILKQELEQKKKEYQEQRAEFQQRMDQDSIVFGMVDEMQVLSAEIEEIELQLNLFDLKEKQIDKEAKNMLAKLKKTKTPKPRDREVFDKKIEEGKALELEIEVLTKEYILKKEEFKSKYNAVKLMQVKREEEQEKEDLDMAHDKQEISDLEQKLADKGVEILFLQQTIDNYSQKKKELSKKKS